MEQQILPLEFPPTFEIKDFIVSHSNEEAYLWLTRWPNWPNRCLAIYGDQGCGKTHLSHIWQNRTKARYLKGQDFNSVNLEILFEKPHLAILDDAHLIEKEEKLFHFYNHLVQVKGSLLLLSRIAPAHWQVELPDLRSRLNAMPAVQISSPDESLLAQVIHKLFADFQVTIDESVIIFLLKHVERSFKSVHKWVEKINSYALIHKRGITIPLIREVLLKEGLVETHR